VETVLLEIFTELRQRGRLDDKLLTKIIQRHNKNLDDNKRHLSKKRLLPYYLKVKESDPERWANWNIDQAMEQRLVQVLQVKPRRTASGVATITVITKPWKCSSDCLYCPSDLRMPKSYLSDEPACQRAERNYFDPYLQVVSRLRALTHMGHATDKIELIVLGGTWSDYPTEYQIWFIAELFRALNDVHGAEQNSRLRRRLYRDKGLSNRAEELSELVKGKQQEVNGGTLTYNQAIGQLYGGDGVWQAIASEQMSDLEELAKQHNSNETAQHRVVGLVIETRPETCTPGNLKLLRRLGCTKVQIGIQSLDPAVLSLNNRHIDLERITKSFELLRAFGFKIHAHFMVNLYGSSPQRDKHDYKRFVTEKPYQPDEVKLYPCSLVNGTGLCAHYDDKSWRPYSEAELIDILIADTLNTPGFIRISRMIRDISAHDILAGNKKANLRQMVERMIEATGRGISEIRYREINTNETDVNQLRLDTISYQTTATCEYFMQWITAENRIAGFLRLSLPRSDYVLQNQAILPIGPHEAMIREVHIYGKVAQLHRSGEGPQHLGLGKQLIEAAGDIARAQGYEKLNVISSVGTREYYRSLGFKDNGLYQQLPLPQTGCKLA
jgi:elongator complex protein 3